MADWLELVDIDRMTDAGAATYVGTARKQSRGRACAGSERALYCAAVPVERKKSCL